MCNFSFNFVEKEIREIPLSHVSSRQTKEVRQKSSSKSGF